LSPTLLRVPPYRLFIWSEENQASFEAPHVHVARGTVGRSGYLEAEIWLGPPVAVKRPGGYADREIRVILRIVEENQELLLERWRDYFDQPG
jgi:hypothetical protein